jgi:hypothetical protein
MKLKQLMWLEGIRRNPADKMYSNYPTKRKKSMRNKDSAKAKLISPTRAITNRQILLHLPRICCLRNIQLIIPKIKALLKILLWRRKITFGLLTLWIKQWLIKRNRRSTLHLRRLTQTILISSSLIQIRVTLFISM